MIGMNMRMEVVNKWIGWMYKDVYMEKGIIGMCIERCVMEVDIIRQDTQLCTRLSNFLICLRIKALPSK